MKLAVVGAGWAGLACAVHATRAGHQVVVFEAARTLGGRARRVDGDEGLALDNGQHILIGAYSATLAMMRELGVDPDAALLRTPLQLRFADGGGLALPRLPAPLDLLAGILFGARGWTLRDKASLLRTALGWRASGFRCAPQASVAELCAGLTPRVMKELVEPLCVSALNTPVDQSSGEVFLRVLHDALFSGRGGADLLLPRVDLGRLLPDAAAAWLSQHGAPLRLGRRVQSLQADGDRWHIDGEAYDQVVLAGPPWEAARLAREANPHWAATAEALRYEAIATVYTQGALRPLAAPMVSLRSGPGAPAQFVFDRGQLGGPQGLLAFVVSASATEREALQSQVLAQAAVQLQETRLRVLQTVVEKRATFACTPDLVRPPVRIAPGLLACGDYIEGPYPATLEGAVRSGAGAALQLGSA
ncbi:hydroxysqualene dehydroxylase HpnE [Variovorax sp. OV329]|uniref:hydroxysqualene dehydroxylase HpnE n=1 Tax=Variovorax sp. OV329 TaxID=1882825 RepID=UPI0008E72D39|nr:hydroxysqualene dehydroxylase HpnE [Variovorax sp. OV329]SFM47319.1 squalene-associated FAD-dependent desaturase [Variovorax sp. OV329]